MWVDEPRMADFLPEELREQAAAEQQSYLVDRAMGTRRPNRSDKHHASPYILKDVLTSVDGVHMTGQTSKLRYYVHSRSHTAPKTGEIRPRVRAEAVEEPILAELRRVLLLAPLLRELVLEKSHEWEEARQADTGRSTLVQRLDEISRKIRVVLSIESDDEVLREQLSALLDEKRQIEKKLAADQGLPHLTAPEIEEVVDALLENLQLHGQCMGTFEPASLKRLIDVFVESAVYDHETRHVEFVMRIPSWAYVEDRMVGLKDSLDSESTPEAHAFMGFQFEFQVPKMWREAAPAWLMSSMPPGGSPPALLDIPRDNPSGPGTGTQAPDRQP